MNNPKLHRIPVVQKELTMRRPIISACCLGTMLLCTSPGGLAQSSVELGKSEYEANCANCHGADGKGSGPYGEMLTRSAADLTTIAKRNGGVFPVKRVYEVIDGRDPKIAAHGPRDMPIWGPDYVSKAGEYQYDNPEELVRSRILALIDYLHRLQAK